MKQNRILVVDDDEAIRDGIGVVLSAQPDTEVVGEAGDRDAALELIETANPDVVLLDIGLPGDDGVQVGMQIAKRFPHVRVVFFSALQDREEEVESLGFRFLPKGCPIKDLLAAITKED